jgi:acyl-CoA thioesterase II
MSGTKIESAWPKYPGYEITGTILEGVGRARHGDLLLAESDRCLVVKESDHVDQLYFPIDDVRWEHFTATDHHTICPFKGEASYWSFAAGDEALENVVWGYPEPFDEVAFITGHVAFYADRFDITVTERWSDDPNDDVTKRYPVWGTADELLALMDVRPIGENRFTAPTYPDPPYGTFFERAKELTARNVIEGGQLLGGVIAAASKAVPDKRVTSAYAIFTKAASFDEPLDIDVGVVRNGRTVAAVDVKVNQANSLRCSGMVMLDAGAEDFMRSAAPMPDVPGPYESPNLDMSVLGRDLREVEGSYRLESNNVGPPEVRVWARFLNSPAEQYQHQALLAQATTHWTIAAAMRPHEGVTEADAHRTVSTGPLSVSLAFHDEVDVTEWMLYSNPAIYAGHGSAQGEGRVYGQDGRLLASYSVQAMIRTFAAPAEGLGGYQTAM